MNSCVEDILSLREGAEGLPPAVKNKTVVYI